MGFCNVKRIRKRLQWHGEQIFEKVTGGTRDGGFVAEVPLRSRVATPYSSTGELFAYLCIAMWGVMLFVWALPTPLALRLSERAFGDITKPTLNFDATF